ncbi:MAG: GNAT family N-acetyltransferase [Candidatus Dadabacteria bacterium]|nr:GNAT family N-acetyltransferase [Candidatus Dadabacteria bacterium]
MLTIRPRAEEDSEYLSLFFSDIPKEDLIIYKEDVYKSHSAETWFLDDNYKKDLQLLALLDNEVVAEGTIHKEGIYWQNAAEIKLIVKPDYRRQGVGSYMFNTLLYEFFQRRIQKVIVRYLPNNDSFIRIINRYGFKPETVLKSYVKLDSENKDQDLIIASYNLEDWVRRFEYYHFIKPR